MDPTLYIAWIALGAFLLIGLVIYERTGRRLGGVLVLPLLLVYALLDVRIVAVFAAAAAAALLIGEVVHRVGLVYGRRLLYVFLLVGVIGTMAAHWQIGLATTTFIVGLLPGLFAYNLHREGRYIEGTSAFAMWFGVLLVAAVAVGWLMTDPGEVASFAANAAHTIGLANAGAGAGIALEQAIGTGAALAASAQILGEGGAAE